MLIKFKSPDPRAGTVAQMDSYRGQQLIDIGAATQLKENGSEPSLTTSGSEKAQVVIEAAPEPIKAEEKKNLHVKNKSAK